MKLEELWNVNDFIEALAGVKLYEKFMKDTRTKRRGSRWPTRPPATT